MTAGNCRYIVQEFFPKGRSGLGNIYVWASGDGGEDDDCNCDGYAASMWTISINSAINDGQNAHYDESCSSTLASTFSNGAKDPNTGVVSFACGRLYVRLVLRLYRFIFGKTIKVFNEMDGLLVF